MTPGDSDLRPRRYRFAEVEIDPANHALRVDGQPRECSRKAFELLLLLVRNPDRVLPREEVMDALWPGGQIVSDEALAQIVFRTRAVLGPYAGLVKTLRGIGLRLDAPVMRVDSGTEATSAAQGAGADPGSDSAEALAEVGVVQDTLLATGAPPRDAGDSQPQISARPPPVERVHEKATTRVGRLPLFALVLVVLATLMVAVAWRLPQWLQLNPVEPEILDEGYGAMRSDLRASNSASAGIVLEALANEANGERDRAERVLQALHAADRTTPIPALYLAIWASGDGNKDEAQKWLGQARGRVGPSPDLYLDLLMAYVAAGASFDPQATIDAAGALLSVRHDAWRMRHARAHLLQFRGMRAAALYEIQQIKVPTLGHRKRDMVIADRASMGDIPGATALLDRIDPASDPVMYSFLRGRLAWSRGDFDAAHAQFRAVANAAYDVGRLDLHTRALHYAGAIEVMRGEDDAALASFDAARTALGGRNAYADMDLSLLLAGLHAEAGRTELMHQELDRALATPPRSGVEATAMAVRFAALRLRPQMPVARPDDLAPAAAALWDAYLAWQQQRPEALRAALALASQRGIETTRWADDARWLQQQAALPMSAETPLDPPYPPLSRVLLRRQIDRASAIVPSATGQTGP
jgi:DNA-binding winged helix-turn-helix (wHTH) protein